jgi:ubiquinol-cytochrome c reductase iron-sulfur subunit
VAEAAGGAHAVSAQDDDATRRDFIFIATGAVAAAGAAMVAWPFIDSMNPARDTLAMASTEYDLTQVPIGQEVVIMWRGMPAFVRHRTPAEIAAAQHDDHNPNLKDPATDASRIVQSDGSPGKPEWLILQASCTHLGCIPTFGGGEFGGWQCACHGSVYDTSGRIRHGPAPKNLYIAPHVFTSDTVVKIG